MLNRRSFFKRLFAATAGATIAYSFPSIIVPKNLEVIAAVNNGRLPIDLITTREIYPKLIQDFWFTDSPFYTYLRKEYIEPYKGEMILKFDNRLVMR